MADGEWERVVRRPEDRCAVTEEPFVPGEEVVTILARTREGFQRLDIKAAAFHQVDVPIFSFWRWKRPENERSNPRRLNLGFLTEFFKRLDQQGDGEEHNERVRWIVGLLLLRKKILGVVERKAEEGREVITLRFKKSEREYVITDPQMDDEAMASITDDLGRIFNLGASGVEEAG